MRCYDRHQQSSKRDGPQERRSPSEEMGQAGIRQEDAGMGQARRQTQGKWKEIETRRTMSIYKRGDVYWYKFMWNGKMVRESTKQGSDKVARQMEAAHRTSLAKGEVGIRDKKSVPTLLEFC